MIGAAVVALAHWDRLTPAEQARFRELARAAESSGLATLSPAERAELTALVAKLHPRKLLGKLVRRLRGGPY